MIKCVKRRSVGGGDGVRDWHVKEEKFGGVVWLALLELLCIY